ncbi:MAG: protein kinase [Gemmatimonadota bacterium]|jgi:serine/threonine-protein kinase
MASPGETQERIKAALADRYLIEGEVGSGGMATVYLAQDLKHDRNVAVKVLRPELAATIGYQRFHGEIRIAAKLQHPNILPLLDSGEAEGFLYYVMPFVEGESLREKVDREGELPVGDVVRILRDVVDALTEAHSNGVVHRDIKPENILLRGRHALVTDFGVAKAVSEATGRAQLTTAGIALGTPTYMAPEQATADPHLDHRVDIYAVGAIAYELLTGRPVFMGPSSQAVLAAHVAETPEPVRKHREAVPVALEALVMRCLEKKAADRWQSADDLHAALVALATPSGGITPTATQPFPGGRRSLAGTMARAATVAVVVALVGVGWWALFGDRTPATRVPGRMTQLTFETGLELDPTLSPDGDWLAYASGPFGNKHIFLRQVSGGRSVDLTAGLPGDHRWPKWSPDGTQIMFQAGGAVYVIPALGGVQPRRIFDHPTHGLEEAVNAVPGARSAVWSPDGSRIAYTVGDTIFVASSQDSEAREGFLDFYPHSLQWSPDGSRLVYVSGNASYVLGSALLGNAGASAIHLLSVADGSVANLTDRKWVYQSPVWLPDGEGILYVSNDGGARDVYQLQLSPSGAPAGSPTRLTTNLGALSISLSADGRLLAYSVFRHDANVWSIPIPRLGTSSVSEAAAVTSGTQTIETPGVSPDGRWLTFDSNRSGNFDIYRLELPDGLPEQLTEDPGDDFIPSWSPNGLEIAFHSFRYGTRDLFIMTADGGSEVRVTDDPGQERGPDWSPDGNSLVFAWDNTGNNELWVMSREDSSSTWGEPRQLTSDGGGAPRWSPAGEWIAYTAAGTLRLVSPEGGSPRILVEGGTESFDPAPVFADWSADGRTVYFKARDSQGQASIWSVPLSGGAPHLLVRFDDPLRPSFRPEFATDGERFFFTVGSQESDICVMELHPG